MTNIRITALTDIGNNIAYSSLVPVVDMAGTPTTKKANLQIVGNLILSGAGGTYFAPAARAILAQSVTNAAQPNITSTGTLTSLTVSGNVNLGAVSNVRITGGNVGQLLATDGNGNLSWVNDPSGVYNNSNVANYLPTFTGTVGANRISSNALSGSNVEINANGAVFTFGQGGALFFPAPPGVLWAIEPNIDNELEIKSTSNVVISTDISNANSHFTFDSDGIFTAPSNVNLLGSRLNVGPDAATAANLLNPTLVIANTGAQYIQAAIINNDAAGSSDWSADGAGGGDDQAWTDMGFAGFSFNDANYTVTAPGDGYLFVQGYANGLGGNMVLATGDHSNTADIIFATGGFLANAEFARIDHSANVFHLTRTGSGIKFQDGSIQTTAATGNIVTVNLDGNVSNVLRGDGTFGADTSAAPAGNTNEIQFNNAGAFAATGNLTFTDGISGGTLEIGPPGALQLDGNGTIVATDFESASDVYIHAANGIIDLRATNYVVLKSDDANVQWVFSNTGSLGVAGNINFSGDPSAAPSLNDFFSITSAANFTIVTDNANADHAWTFDTVGNLTLPGNTLAINFANGSSAFGNIVSVNLDGNVSNVLRGDGTFSADANSSYGDSNVVSLLGSFGSNTITTTGNVRVGPLTPTQIDTRTDQPLYISSVYNSNNNAKVNVQFDYDSNINNVTQLFYGKTSFGNNGQAPIVDFANTTVNNLDYNSIANTPTLGNVSALNLDGNVANVLRGDGTFAADANSSYGDSNVVSLLGSFGSNTITTTGNVSVGNISGNGAGLSSLTGANVSGQVTYAATANSVAGGNVVGTVSSATTATTAGTVTTNAQPNITSVGTLSGLTIAANGDIVMSGAGSQITGVYQISSTLYFGNGSQLSALTGSNVTGTVPRAAIANSVAGANVSGEVSFANVANSVAGANVSGNVSAALVAYSVDLANVSGAGNIASVNLDGNVSNVLTGNGTFTALPVIDANTVIWTTAPTANTDPGTAGQAAYDAGGNLYVCVSTNTWSKISGTTSW